MTAIKETLLVSNYNIYTKRKSLIDPEVTFTVKSGMLCPKCKTALNSIEHGASYECDCGLKMTVYGNSLDCEITI